MATRQLVADARFAAERLGGAELTADVRGSWMLVSQRSWIKRFGGFFGGDTKRGMQPFEVCLAPRAGHWVRR